MRGWGGVDGGMGGAGEEGENYHNIRDFLLIIYGSRRVTSLSGK